MGVGVSSKEDVTKMLQRFASLIGYLLPLGCEHANTSRAFKDHETGRDYIVCLACGKTFDSPIQFGKEKHEINTNSSC